METVMRIKIKRNDSGGSIIRLELAYDSQLGYIMLDKDMEYATIEQYNNGERKPYEIVLGKNEIFKVIKIDLSGLTAPEHSLEKKYALKQQRLRDAILNHPHVVTDDTAKNVTKARFIAIDETTEKAVASKNIKKRIAVGNFINSLDEAGLRNLSAYLNRNTAGVDADAIYVEMLQERKEIIGKDGRSSVIEGWAYSEMDKVLAVKTDELAELIIVINKAVALKIIDQKDSGFWYGGHLVATSEEELRKHFKDNVDLYERGLKPSVFEKDNLPISFNNAIDISSGMDEIKKSKVQDLGVASAERSEALKARAKDLGIQGNVNGMKDETLEMKIREREQTLATIEANKK